MRQAKLQGADMRLAQLQGADMGLAQLQGANMGGAQLQGADMGGANIWQTSFKMTHFDLTDLRYANSDEPPAPGAVQKLLASVPPQARQRVEQALTPHELKAEDGKAHATGSVLVDADTRLRPDLEAAIAAQRTEDEAAFDAKLAPFLAKIAASFPAAASGIARRVGREAEFDDRWCLHRDLAGRLLAGQKDGRITLDANTRERLQIVAGRSPPKGLVCLVPPAFAPPSPR